jgi:hypothetical protein
MRFQEWLNESGVVVVNIEDLLPAKDDMEVAIHSLQNGRPSTDTSPIQTYQVSDKYVVANGHHRLLQAILKGNASVKVIVLPGEVSTRGTITLDFYDGDYYGLDSSLSNGWLLKRL